MSEASLTLKVDSTDVARGSKSLDELAQSGSKAEIATNALTKATDILANAARVAAGAFGTFKAIQYAQESAMLSARYETMGIVMKVAGNNAGYYASQMESYSKELQKSGISMLQSRDALTQLATAHIDLSKAASIGRSAQDLAVVANTNSSEAMQRMIYGIKSGQVEVLRTLGLNVNFESSYKSMALQLGVNEKALTEQQKTLARTNAVLAESKNYTGIYEESMTTAGKAMSSLTRYSENLKIKIGDIFLPALADAVFKYTDALKAANAEMDKAGSAGNISRIGDGLGSAFRTVYETVVVLGANVAYVLTTIGNEIGGIAAQANAMLHGNFSEAGTIGKHMVADAEAGRKAIDAFSEKILAHGDAVKKVSKYNEDAAIATAKDAQAKAAAEEKSLKAADAAKKYAEEHQKSVTSMLDALQKEADTLGMTTEQIKLYEAAKLGMSPVEFTYAASILEGVAAFKAEEEAATKAAKATEILASARESAERKLSAISRNYTREVDGIGMGNKYRSNQSAINQIEDVRTTESQRLDSELRKNEITKEQHAIYLSDVDETYRKEVELYDRRTADIEEKQRNWMTGMSEAMRNYLDEVSNVAKQTEHLFTNAFKQMEDALVKFVRTGKMDFRSLADSIINDMIRIQVQQKVMGPLVGTADNPGILSKGLGSLVDMVLGKGSSTPTSQPSGQYSLSSSASSFGLKLPSIAGFKADGGPVDGGSAYIVGERGPELFIPSTSGSITPNHALGGGSQVSVNTTFAPVIHAAPGTDTAGIIAAVRQLMPAFIAENKRAVVGAVNQSLLSRGQSPIRA